MTSINQKLKESEEKFSKAFRSSPNLIAITRMKDGRIVDVNDAFTRILGYKREELIGHTTLELNLWVDPQERSEFVKRLEADNKVDIFDVKIYTKSGEILSTLFSGDVIDLNNEPHLITMASDISDRRKAEQKLKESEEKYSNLFQHSNDGIFLHDLDGNIIDVNRKVLEQLGYTKSEILSLKVSQLHPTSEIGESKKAFDKISENGFVRFEVNFKKKNGEIFPAEVSSSLFTIGGEKVIQGVVRDITNRKLSGLKLKESEEKYRSLFNNMAEGFAYHKVIVDKNNKPIDYEYIEVNPAFEKLTGLKADQIIGKKVTEILPGTENDPADWIGKFGNVGLTGIPLVVEDYSEPLDRWYKVSGYSPKKGYFAVTFTDITEQKKSELRIKESELKFRDLYEEAPTAYFSIGKDKSILRCNRAAEKLLGYTEDEFIKMKVFDLYTDSEFGIERAKRMFTQFLGGKTIEDVEMQMTHKNGNPVWISLYVKPIFDQEGNVIESRSMILDITDRRVAEEALKESEEKFRTITEQSFLGISIVQENKIKYVNNQLAHIFGYTVEEIMNWEVGGFLNVIHPEDREMVAKQARKKQLGESNSIDQYQFRGIKKNGDNIWLEIYSKSIIYNGKPADFATIHDVTEGKIFEQRLLESEEKFRSIFETIPDLFFLVSGDTTILDYKGNLEELYLPPEEFLGKKLTSVMPENVAVLSSNSITKTLETHEPQIVEYNLDMNGKSRFYEARHLYFSEDKVLVFIRDITERKKIQENLLISEKKFRESYDRANFYKDLFAHDMNNILQVINSSAELISIQLGDSEKSKNISNITTIIKRQIERGAKLVYNVRTLSELEEEDIITKRVEINKFIKNARAFVTKAYDRRNIRITFESVRKKHYTNANELLQDVFENVLINSIRYNENSNIEITIKISKQEIDAEDYVKIEFIDNGIGVSDERKEVIFLSGHRELKGSKGMGLGLSLVSKILTIFNGKVWVEDKIKGDYTKGSNFVILLPEIK